MLVELHEFDLVECLSPYCALIKPIFAPDSAAKAYFYRPLHLSVYIAVTSELCIHNIGLSYFIIYCRLGLYDFGICFALLSIAMWAIV